MSFFLGLVGLGHHDSSAALVDDKGELLAAAEEERYTRIKFDPSFPKNSIDYCLHSQGIKITDISSIGFFFDSQSFFWERLFFALKKPVYLRDYLSKYLKLKKYESIQYEIKKNYPEFKGKINFHHHHLCHAASVYFSSPFEKSTIVSIDGVGEWETAWFGLGEGNKISKLGSVGWPNSLGEFYASLTQYLGYKANSDEYKVMGMAPYGEPEYLETLGNMVSVDKNHHFKIEEKYFDFTLGKQPLYNLEKFTELFGPPSVYSQNPNKRDINLAASFQKKLSECFIEFVRHAVEKTGIRNVCLTGGVAMNCAAIGDLVKSGVADQIFLNFASADDGCAIGAAFLECLNSSNFTRREVNNAFLGNEWSDFEIKKSLDLRSIKYTNPSEGIIEKTSNELCNGKIIGWFQGRTEFGQRALGSRSILADPSIKDMKNIINKKIKNRESFRPFAPSILHEKAKNFYNLYQNSSPFMTHTFEVKKDFKNEIPSVVHVDNTSRVQTVKEEGKYFKLIKSFYEKSNIPMVLNTSFNVNGEPIVNTPEEAINCFLSTEIDNLSIGSFFCFK